MSQWLTDFWFQRIQRSLQRCLRHMQNLRRMRKHWPKNKRTKKTSKTKICTHIKKKTKTKTFIVGDKKNVQNCR